MIPDLAVELVKKWEGLHKVDKATGLVHPYVCPAGVWTIGYGSTRLLDGSNVLPSTPPITKEQAEELMKFELEKCVRTALFLSPILQWSQSRLSAISSFIFNLGWPAYRASTLRRKVNEQEWEEAAEQIQRWVFAGGRKLPGLIARRKDEAQYLCP